MTQQILDSSISPSGLNRLLILLMIILVCMFAGSLISMLVWNIGSINLQDVLAGEQLSRGQRNIFRIGLMFNHAFTFLISGIIYCLIFHRSDPRHYLKLDSSFSTSSLVLWGLVILSSYPLIAQLTEWNNIIPLPEWLTSSQSDAFALLTQTLQMDGFLELAMSILLVGVLAAVGEEIIFRGIVQNEFLNSWGNHHTSILMSSLIFGSFHLQFERVIPLAFLGIILGYSYHYSKSLWVPVFLHFANNSFQVLSIYIVTRNGEMPAVDEIPDLPLTFVIGSLFFTIILALGAIRISTPKE